MISAWLNNRQQNTPFSSVTASRSTLGTLLASVVGLFTLFIYLFSVRIGLYLPIYVFWASTLVVLLSLVMQGLSQNEKSAFRWSFLILILFVWQLKTIFIPVEVPFFGSDAYIERAATLEIAEFTWLGLSPWNFGLSKWIHSTNYPILSTIALSLTEPIGFPLISWNRWGMPTISLISLLFVYSITLEMYQSRRVALLASVGFGTTYMYLMFHSLYLREGMAFIFFLATVYSFIKEQSNPSVFYRIVALLCSVGVILSHHLTSFFMLLFFILFICTERILTLNFIPPPFKQTKKNNTILWMFIFVALLTYSVYLQHSPLHIMKALVQDATSGVTATSFALPSTGRYNLLLYSQALTTLLFGLLATYSLFIYQGRQQVTHITFVVWGGLAGMSTLLFILAGIPGTSSLASRFELFGYVFLLPAAAYGAHHLVKKQPLFLLPLVFLFTYYGLNTINRFPLYLYSQSQPSFTQGEVRPSLLPEEFNLLERIQSEAEIASDSTFLRLLPSISGLSTSCWFCTLSETDEIKFDLLVVGEKQSTLLAAQPNENRLERLRMSRIYSAGSAAIYLPSLDADKPFTLDKILSFSDKDQKSTWVASFLSTLILLLELSLICLVAIGIMSLAPSSKIEHLGLGIVLVFLGIFALYFTSNVLGFQSPGLLTITALIGSVAGLSWRLRGHQFYRPTILIVPVALSVLLFGYGPLVDGLSANRISSAYSEFYVEDITPCQESLCVGLHVINRAESEMSYRIDGVEESITLDPSAEWQGVSVVSVTDKKARHEINLYQQGDELAQETLILNFNE